MDVSIVVKVASDHDVEKVVGSNRLSRPRLSREESRLELAVQRHLQSSLLATHAVDEAKLAVGDAAVGSGVVRHVESVKSIQTEAQLLVLGDREVLEQGAVHLIETMLR